MRRAANSSLAGEAHSLVMALAECDWIQLMVRDARKGDVPVSDWRSECGPYVSALRGNCQLREPLPAAHVTDAKSIFDHLSRLCAGRKEDRRTAIDLAIARESFEKRGSRVWWVPHLLNPSDPLTHSDVGQGSEALSLLLRTARLTLSDADEQQAALAASGEYGRRSQAAQPFTVRQHISDFHM